MTERRWSILIALWVMFCVALFSGVVGVAIHFIAKFW